MVRIAFWAPRAEMRGVRHDGDPILGQAPSWQSSRVPVFLVYCKIRILERCEGITQWQSKQFA